jgi:hypothetical protein
MVRLWTKLPISGRLGDRFAGKSYELGEGAGVAKNLYTAAEW